MMEKIKKLINGGGSGLLHRIKFDLKIDKIFTFFMAVLGVLIILLPSISAVWKILILFMPILIWYNSYLLTERDLMIYEELLKLNKKINGGRRK